MTIRRREALVATARSLDVETSVDGELRKVRNELESVPNSVPARTDARQQVAELEADLERKRERVATLRGRMREAADGEFEIEYRAAIRDLSEAETSHAAAIEALADARERARSARDTREARFRLEDRLGNLQRKARRELLETITPKVDAAVANVPKCDRSTFADADAISAALALVRVGQLERPILLACRRFSDRSTAEDWLGCPILVVSPD